MDNLFYEKYLKYKAKYLALGGGTPDEDAATIIQPKFGTIDPLLTMVELKEKYDTDVTFIDNWWSDNYSDPIKFCWHCINLVVESTDKEFWPYVTTNIIEEHDILFDFKETSKYSDKSKIIQAIEAYANDFCNSLQTTRESFHNLLLSGNDFKSLPDDQQTKQLQIWYGNIQHACEGHKLALGIDDYMESLTFNMLNTLYNKLYNTVLTNYTTRPIYKLTPFLEYDKDTPLLPPKNSSPGSGSGKSSGQDNFICKCGFV